MNLELMYSEIKSLIGKVDFSKLWINFKPSKFAIYNENECFFDGKYIIKTDEFIANTSIYYNGEFIAIYKVSEEEDIEILTSLIIHEMFHAFQNINNESRFSNEIEAVYKYSYSTENLSIKHEENLLIAGLIKSFNKNDFFKLLQYRKYRYSHFNYEYNYEVAVEQIEGTARFVELNALKQISEEKYESVLNKMIEDICDYKNLFPIRILSYSIGALFFKLLKDNHLINFEYFENIPTSTSLINDVEETEQKIFNYKIDNLIKDYYQECSGIINKTLATGQCIESGVFKLLGLNVYDARYYQSFIISNYFIMYELHGSSIVKSSNSYFLIELNEDKMITRIFCPIS